MNSDEMRKRLLAEYSAAWVDGRAAAVRILSAPPDTVARVEGETKDETIDRLHKVLHERNQAWAWERRERERAEAAEAGWKAQRDAAITRADETEAALRHVNDVAGKVIDQRDRALALLRSWLAARGGGPMLISDTRALLAEMDG